MKCYFWYNKINKYRKESAQRNPEHITRSLWKSDSGYLDLIIDSNRWNIKKGIVEQASVYTWLSSLFIYF